MVHNPPGLYSAGNLVVSQQPEINQYANLMARQQAKWDAMDNYERSRINSVNDAGLRDQDRKKLDDSLADLRSHYNTNKKDIQKGNSQAAFDYEKKFRDVRTLIAESKDRAARHNAALTFYNDRLKQDQRLPDDFMTELHANDMPIGEKYVDPTGKISEFSPFDITKWASEAKPFVQDKYVKGFGDIKRNQINVSTEKIPGNDLRLNEITELRFDTPAKQVIAARAANQYDNSYSFSNQVKNEIADPVRRKALSDLFKAEYGVEPSMPSDYAVAYTMELLQPSTKVGKQIDNKAAVMDRTEAFRRAFQEQGFQNNKQLASLRNYYSNMNYEQRSNAISGDVDAVIDDQKKNATKDTFGNMVLKVSPLTLEAFKDANTGGYQPEKIILLPNGNFELRGGEHYKTREITPSEYKAGLVNKAFNTTTKINQIAPKTNTQSVENKSNKKASPKVEDLRKKYNY